MTTGHTEQPNYVNYDKDNSKIGISSTELFSGIARMYTKSKKFLEYDVSCFEKVLENNLNRNENSAKGAIN
jgi:hypothetical protein